MMAHPSLYLPFLCTGDARMWEYGIMGDEILRLSHREGAMTHPTHVLPTSRHFHLHQLAEGVFAAISIPGTGSMSNAGIIDLGDATLIFDTFSTPQAALDLRHAAEQLALPPIAYVVNSHKHGDHFWGNQVFAPGSSIIATTTTRADILRHANESREAIQQDLENDIQELESKLIQEPNRQKRRSQESELASRREILAALPTFERTAPNFTFEQSVTLYGSKRTVEALTYGGGHTASDAFLYLPDDHLIFMGDLLFARTHPWMGDGNPEEWGRILERIEQLSFTIAVPGHGPPGGKEDLVLNRQYLFAIPKLAELVKGAGMPLDEAKKIEMPAAFEHWDGADVFDWNMEFLYAR
jgi:cyclase